MRLIDADKLIEDLKYIASSPFNCDTCEQRDSKTCIQCVSEWALGKAPTVDTVSHGEWVEDICCDEVIICNACGNEAYFDLDEGTYIEFDYCPFCGAKMVGEANGTG